jgi:predicted enzyme related to lactoylglutathione lyase
LKKVTGIGGVFFKCNQVLHQKQWYAKHLGLQMDEWGTSFEWRQPQDSTQKGFTAWSPFEKETPYFGSPEQQYMINYRVDDLFALVKQLKEEGVTIVDEMEITELGKFIHILDGEGNQIELWEPNDLMYEKNAKALT